MGFSFNLPLRRTRMIGRQALTVTTNLSINFLRKPAAETDLICEARILKLPYGGLPHVEGRCGRLDFGQV